MIASSSSRPLGAASLVLLLLGPGCASEPQPDAPPELPQAEAPRGAEGLTDGAPEAPFRAHRLTRAQLGRAAGHLLGVPVDAARWLPPDVASLGFDNTEGGLYVSPSFLQSWRAAVREAVELALHRGDVAASWSFQELAVRARLTWLDDLQAGIDGLPTSGWTDERLVAVVPFDLPLRTTVSGLHTLRVVHRAQLSADELPQWEVDLQDVLAVDRRWDAGTFRTIDEVQVELDAGTHVFQGVNLGAGVVSVEVLPPPGTPPNPARAALLSCTPATRADWEACAAEILEPFAHRAWRRPVTAEEVDGLVGVVAQVAADTGAPFDAALGQALQAVLLSPHFLFRFEDEGIGPVSALELASRLSFALWASVPDAELLDLAESGALLDAGVLDAQVRRMLASPHAEGFVEDFGGQWLGLHSLDLEQRDVARFPLFGEPLRAAMRAESLALFGRFARGELTLPELLTTPTGTVQAPLDALYGLPGPSTSADLGSVGRRGLLGTAAFLTMTSAEVHPSVVHRGLFVLTTLLCEGVEGPPPGVARLMPGQDPREAAVSRANNPACTRCHDRMDPIGQALEGFDAVGARRSTYADGAPVSAEGALDDGTPVSGLDGLATLLADDPRLPVCLARHLTTWSLGRALHPDHPAVLAVAEALTGPDASLPDAMAVLTQAEVFRRHLEVIR
ncbi:MAG: DUF1592 domain-containing protein [Alphaproteobacteria bacterium]|nr:DUF1592 domain-containing protein [Alphaproteobacteria bacterium]